MKDAFGETLNVGDLVMVPMRVTSVNDDHVGVETAALKPGADFAVGMTIDGAQAVRALPNLNLNALTLTDDRRIIVGGK